MEYEKWLDILKEYMVKTEIITIDTILDKKCYLSYFEQKLNPYETLRLEFGKDWVEKHQDWYLKNRRKELDNYDTRTRK